MAVQVKIKMHKGIKLYYDEVRKILFIDEIPNAFYNKNIHYPIWNDSIKAEGLCKKDIIVPHFHILPNGDLVKMENVKFPIYYIPLVKSIELVNFEENGKNYHWTTVENRVGMYRYMITSDTGCLEYADNLKWETELPEYLKKIKL